MQTHKPLSTSQGKKLFTKGTWVSAEQNLNEGRRTDRKAMQMHTHECKQTLSPHKHGHVLTHTCSGNEVE